VQSMDVKKNKDIPSASDQLTSAGSKEKKLSAASPSVSAVNKEKKLGATVVDPRIEWIQNVNELVSFVPNSTVEDFVQNPGKSLCIPSCKVVEGALAVIDISGLNSLPERFAKPGGAEVYATFVNGVYKKLVEIIHDHGGDIIKFAGTALMVIWTERPFIISPEQRREQKRQQILERKEKKLAAERLQKAHEEQLERERLEEIERTRLLPQMFVKPLVKQDSGSLSPSHAHSRSPARGASPPPPSQLTPHQREFVQKRFTRDFHAQVSAEGQALVPQPSTAPLALPGSRRVHPVPFAVRSPLRACADDEAQHSRPTIPPFKDKNGLPPSLPPSVRILNTVNPHDPSSHKYCSASPASPA
jgi:hypothetical protein